MSVQGCICPVVSILTVCYSKCSSNFSHFWLVTNIELVHNSFSGTSPENSGGAVYLAEISGPHGRNYIAPGTNLVCDIVAEINVISCHSVW
jgi:hypothetical protein